MAENEHKFQKLTPCTDADITIYENALDFIFENPDIKNVAITGAYGAGKSSIIESYKKSNPKLKSINISLAHFQSTGKENDISESVLEGKILNQLIHQIPASQIPQTNFKIKEKVLKSHLQDCTFYITLFLIPILYMLGHDLIYTIGIDLSPKFLNTLIMNIVDLFVGLFWTGTLIFFIYKLVELQKNKNLFRKIIVQGNEIEIFDGKDESYFDKYLNEVLYLFGNTETDVIIFEDIDRFNISEIFERLREINNLVNIKLLKDGKKQLRFFYLLRDDIFVSKDRTKFFDFIMPIIPFVDSSNSYDQLLIHFKDDCYAINNNFLQHISLYVDDMRILKNTYNEFTIYYHKLKDIRLNCNKMLAIMLYKNLFPKDFSDLQLNKGFVFNLFDNKEILINQNTKNIQDKVDEKNEEIKRARAEHLNSVSELDIIVSAYNQRYGNNNHENREAIKLRKEALDNKLNNRMPLLEEEAKIIEKEISTLKSKKLEELINRDNIDRFFQTTKTDEVGNEDTFDEIRGNEYFPLLKYLIRYGHIDESYADYMTPFYGDSLHIGDKIFLRSIFDKETEENTYKLTNIKLVITKLQIEDFDHEEILNFDLLEYLLSPATLNIKFVNRFFSQLKETKNFKFISEYFDAKGRSLNCIKNLNLQWVELFHEALDGSHFTEKEVRQYSLDSIYYSENNNLKNINIDNCMGEYISNIDDYLNVSDPNIEKLINGFKILEVSFKSINYDKSNKELFDKVYGNSLYEINFENIKLMLLKIYNIKDDEDIFHKNYTLICEEAKSPLVKYIDDNIVEYIDIVLENSDNKINDDENIALKILNNNDSDEEYNDNGISIEQKQKYLELLETPITTISAVANLTLWNYLLESRKVLYSEDNILEYFKLNKYDPLLIDFINDSDTSLDFSKLNESYTDEDKKIFISSSVIQMDLQNHKYKEIISTLNVRLTISIALVNSEKLHILIDCKRPSITEDWLIDIRKSHPDDVLYFIEKNIDEYRKIMTASLFNLNELIEILTLDIGDETKLELLAFAKTPISILGKGYSTAINVYILENNLDDKELHDLIKDYDNFDVPVQNILLKLAIKNINDIISNTIQISNILLDHLINNDDLDNSIKIELFISYLPSIDQTICSKYLTILKLTEYLDIFDTKLRPKFDINDTNMALLTAFKNKGWISTFKEDVNNSKYSITRIKKKK